MKIGLLTVIIMSIETSTPATAHHLTGEYSLEGVMETASGFVFNPDSTFEFHYSYGALDRTGSGRYVIKNDQVILNSKNDRERDFKLMSSRHASYPGTIVKITDQNSAIVAYVACTIKTEHGTERLQTDKEGVAKFSRQYAQSISLLHLLYPDRASVFPVQDKAHNYFEFTIDRRIVNVHFDNLALTIEGDELTGRHPLIGGEKYRYVKQ